MVQAWVKITPPSFKKDAIPTKNGWRHPKTNELLVSKSITQQQIDDYMGITAAPAPKPKPKPAPVVEDVPLENMSKLQLETLGREHGHELDRRKSKSDLIEELEELGIG